MIISDDVARKLWFKLDGGVHVHVEPLLASLRKQFTLSESEADGIQKALPAKGGNLSVLGYAQFFEKGLVQSVADFRAKLQVRRRWCLLLARNFCSWWPSFRAENDASAEGTQ